MEGHDREPLESRGNYNDDASGIRFVELLEPIKYNESDAYCVLVVKSMVPGTRVQLAGGWSRLKSSEVHESPTRVPRGSSQLFELQGETRSQGPKVHVLSTSPSASIHLDSRSRRARPAPPD
ncbi:Protein of unknown function [Pyronema omphalodes CBS 100304]|uniref:Uncharacterized protein n=1 Tax=Pyronema omphalodes (strain CBS 100304) TaxID=1076935 RepID=U4LW27_PYROM|nr:Protein of unknown function [Pyronema omphalodes CBS 100304]